MNDFQLALVTNSKSIAFGMVGRIVKEIEQDGERIVCLNLGLSKLCAFFAFELKLS